MPLFLSTYTNRIDKKGRVSLPAPFRVALAETGSEDPVLFPSFTTAAIEGWSHARIEGLVNSIDAFDPFSDDHDDFATAIASAAQQLKLDGEGRLILPERFLAHAELSDSAVFVGLGKGFQIWHPAAFEVHAKEARARARERKNELRWKDTSNGGQGNDSR
jgi:MraZ protein